MKEDHIFYTLRLNDSNTWNFLLTKFHPDQQDIYFSPEYYRLYEEFGDGQARCFVYEKGKELALYPFLINSVNSLGYELSDQYSDIQGAYGYNGIIYTSNEEFFVNDFYKAFNQYCIDNKIIAEFTRFHPLIDNSKFSEKAMDIVLDRKTTYVDLNRTYVNIFNSFQTTTRKQVKRCRNRHHMEVEVIEKDDYLIEDFYSIYIETMDRVQSIRYLYFNINYFKELILNTKSALFIAKIEGKPIAAIIIFYNTVYVHGHLGGALTNYLYTSPYSLLYSEIIRFGIERGCRYFHIGGGATNNPDDPLLKFKMNFSSTLSDFYVGKRIHNPEVYKNVVSQWEQKFPEKIEKYDKFLLKYRY